MSTNLETRVQWNQRNKEVLIDRVIFVFGHILSVISSRIQDMCFGILRTHKLVLLHPSIYVHTKTHIQCLIARPARTYEPIILASNIHYLRLI